MVRLDADAKDERDKLKKERDALRQEVTQLQVDGAENKQLRALLDINTAGRLKATSRDRARLRALSEHLVLDREINKGSSDGVRADQPVVNGEGLVGKVKSVSDGNAIVMLLTDQDFGVSAKAASSGEPGRSTPRSARRATCCSTSSRAASSSSEGERIVTAGTVSSG